MVIGDIDDQSAGEVAGEIGATATVLDVTKPDSASAAVAGTGRSRSW